MTSKILKNALEHRLEEFVLGDRDIVVLKGIPLSLLVDNLQPINLEDICKDKISYLFTNIYKLTSIFNNSFSSFIFSKGFATS